MQSPTAKMMLTEDNGSNVVPQKCKAPITSINVIATQLKTIKHIFVSPSSRKVIENTQAKASPKFLHNSNPEKNDCIFNEILCGITMVSYYLKLSLKFLIFVISITYYLNSFPCSIYMAKRK